MGRKGKTMTREEAINWLKAISFVSDHRITEALDMAIEALHREEAEAKGYCHRIKPKAEASQNLAKPNKALKGSDLISRSDAINCCSCLHPEDCWEEIKKLPSAEAVQGEWKDAYRKTANFVEFSVLACSECNYADPQMNYYNYCPNCGADMRGGKE